MIGTLGKWIVYACLLLTGFARSGLSAEKLAVTLYTTAGCRPCRQALESLRELPITLTVTQDCPSWVTQVPVIHWRDRAGVWRQHAPQHWSGPTWSDLETEKIRRWLLPSSATKSTARGGYLTVTSDSLPAPYYQRGPVKLYHADCLELLPHLPRVDAVVTDPPYGLGMRTVSGGTSRNTQTRFIDQMKSMNWDDCIPSKNVFDALREIGDWQLFWGGNYFELPPTRCVIVWDKMTYVPTMSRVEIAWTSLDKPAAYVQINSNQTNRQHPTQKPVRLIEWCLDFCPYGQTILDPYLGSGTTAVACIRTGRQCIGIELEERYLEIAAKRCDRELDQGRLPFDAPPKRVDTQRELFAEVSRG